MNPKGYTDKTNIENYMLVEIDGSFDTQVDEWIRTIEEYIEHETNKDFAKSDDTATDRVYDGDGTQTLRIDPAKEVVGVKLSPTGTAIDTDQYVLYPANQTVKDKIKLKNIVFPTGDQNIVVKAKYGLENVPRDIEFAATVLVAGIIQNAWQSEGEVQSMTIGRYTVTYKDAEQIQDFNKVSDILEYNKKYDF